MKISLESQIWVLVFRLKWSKEVEDFAGKWASISPEILPTSSEIWISKVEFQQITRSEIHGHRRVTCLDRNTLLY